MANKKSTLARQQKESEAYEFPRSKDCDIGSAKRAILEQMERNKGLIKTNYIASYDGKGISLSDLISCLHILADPTHRENRWSCLVEMVKYDDDIYLRLVPSIPLAVKEKWEMTGKPPRQMATNDVQLMISEILSRTNLVSGEKETAKAPFDNPYSPTGSKKYHKAFNMAADWIPLTELLAKIEEQLCGDMEPDVRAGNAHSLLVQIANPTRNNGRSHMEKKTASGVDMIRVVPGPG